MAKKQTQQDVLLVTQDGYNQMVAELEERLQKRDLIAQEIEEARKLGDLSENAPYTEAMSRKEINDARIDELTYLISIAQIIESDAKSNIVGIGNTVEIQREDEKTKRTVTLVGAQAAQEADPRENKISIDSPVGKALNMAQVGDKVVVELPLGEVTYKILRLVA